MDLKNVTNGGKEFAQNSYLGSLVDNTITNQMVECLHFSERSSSQTENLDCDGDVEVHKIKDKAPMEEDKLIANGRLSVDGEDSNGSCLNGGSVRNAFGPSFGTVCFSGLIFAVVQIV
eukprot:Gb_00126 [translate_table: standard]